MSRALRRGWMLAAAAAALLRSAPPGCADEPAAGASPLFSEDFESGTLDPAVWTKEVTGANVISVQSDKVAHGKYALKVSCPAPSSRTWAFIAARHLPEALRQHQWEELEGLPPGGEPGDRSRRDQNDQVAAKPFVESPRGERIACRP